MKQAFSCLHQQEEHQIVVCEVFGHDVRQTCNSAVNANLNYEKYHSHAVNQNTLLSIWEVRFQATIMTWRYAHHPR